MILNFMSMLDTDEEKTKMQQIFETYQGTMLAVAKTLISDHSLAEDAVSEAIMTIIKNLHKIDGVLSHKTKAYIAIIVRSRAKDILRTLNKYTEDDIYDLDIPNTEMPIADELTMREYCDNIVKHIRALPKALSDVLYLSVVFEHTNNEISEMLNISNDAVRKRLSRAKSQIKTTLAKEGIEYAKK